MTAGYDATNIFAKILRGELPCHKVCEDADVLAMLDIFPHSRGHTLVIPKAPSRNLLDAEPATLSAVIPKVQMVARAVLAATGADGLRIAQFNEAPAGQSVFHLHFHLIPAYDGQPVPTRSHGRGDDAELAALAKDIAARLG